MPHRAVPARDVVGGLTVCLSEPAANDQIAVVHGQAIRKIRIALYALAQLFPNLAIPGVDVRARARTAGVDACRNQISVVERECFDEERRNNIEGLPSGAVPMMDQIVVCYVQLAIMHDEGRN